MESSYRNYSGNSGSHSPDSVKRKSRSKSRSPYHRYHQKRHNSHIHKKSYQVFDLKEDDDRIGRRRDNSEEFDDDSDRDYRGKEDNPFIDDSSSYGRTARSRSPRDDYRADRDRRSFYNRGHDRDRDRGERDYYHHRSSRRRSRSNDPKWDRERERKGREKDRFREDDDDRDSDSETRSPNGGGIIGASGCEIIGFKSRPPNNTIMIRGLAQHITENDIRQDIIQSRFVPKDIRLIRKKDTGASRGFAFVEFATVAEAVRWMELKQGILMLHHHRAIMQYSIPKDTNGSDKPPSSVKVSADWFCIKCGAQNFKRRDNCFKCHASRTESEEGGSGCDETCSYTTKTIMFRNLDVLTTEDSVMSVLNKLIPDLVKSISAVCIGRDPLTSTSRGICYLGTDSTIDALAIYGALNRLDSSLIIDGKSVILSYCKYCMGDTKKAYSQADHAAFPNASIPQNYTMSDVENLAEYAARRYAKSPEEYTNFIEYYRLYFTQQINAGNTITLHNENQMDTANVAAAVAQSAIQQVNATKTYFDNTHIQIPNGTDGKLYPVPDLTKYVEDKSTGYQYDATTGLYYDPKSSYYWNSVIQKYLFYDHEKCTYNLAPSYYSNSLLNNSKSSEVLKPATNTDAMNASNPIPEEPKKTKPEKQDKAKVAKKIAKDMERWAKTMNQKKDFVAVRGGNDANVQPQNPTATADIAFSVLEKKSLPNSASGTLMLFENGDIDSMDLNSDNSGSGGTGSVTVPAVVVPAALTTSIVAAAQIDSPDSWSDEEDDGNECILDYNKLICNLCKRKLGSAEALTKHAKMSSLHKQNMETRRINRLEPISERPVYRDRAKERRMKYGDASDEPQPSKLKEKYLKALDSDIHITSASVGAAQAAEPIGSENVGNRLLQKMGWMEGQGLGKSNQGRTTIIEAEQYSSTAGLGNKLPGFSATVGDTYKDCVKKMMYARYQELTERESTYK